MRTAPLLCGSRMPSAVTLTIMRQANDQNQRALIEAYLEYLASTIPLSLFFALLLFISPSSAKTSPKPRALLLRVTKDAATKQYVTVIRQRTPLVPIKLTVDLGQRFLWVDCEKGYVSSSVKSVLCDSTPCNLSRSGMCSGNCSGSSIREPGCTCSHLPYNHITRTNTGCELKDDVISLQSTDGSTSGPIVSSSNLVFDCVVAFLLEGLAKGIEGIAALGNGFVGLPTQLATAFKIPRKFALCLSSSTSSSGVIFSVMILMFFFQRLNLKKDGQGRIKISTVDPYT
uniref:Basic 7S globulin 2-like n=1 Tax=Nicotiana tabacum TaxID=4097 RepID=A0A1S4AUC3_TOBAC